MKRREFVEKAGVGAAAWGARGRRAPGPRSGDARWFRCVGIWVTGVRLGAAAGLPNNIHALIPNEVKIMVGGTVNFIIAGFHLLVVYGDGTQPGDINTAITVAPTNAAVPPLIATRRTAFTVESIRPFSRFSRGRSSKVPWDPLFSRCCKTVSRSSTFLTQGRSS